jgi:hypothetical protein
MKILCSLLLSVTIGGYCSAQSSSNKPYLTKSFAGASIQNVEVETSGGGITLQGVDPAQSRVEIYIKSGNGRDLSNDEIQKRLDEYYDVKVELNGGKLYASVKSKDHMHLHWGSDALSITFKVYAPKSISSHLNTSGGGIDIRDFQGGNQEFSTSGGGLEVNDISGTIKGTTSGGGIHVSHASNTIHLTTSGGGISADHCTGTIYLETSGGGLELNDLSGTIEAGTSGGGIDGMRIDGDLETHTSGGSIDLKDLSCTLDASSSGGGVSVSMLQLGKSIKLTTSAGSIVLRLPSGKGLDLTLDADRISTENLGAFNGTTDKEHMKGSVNGGGIPVRLDASSGSISVSCR